MKYPDKLVVVDDDKIFLLIHKNMLQNMAGIEPLTFVNGKQVLEYFDELDLKDEEVLLFLDLNMPVMNGWEFLDNLQNRDYAGNIRVAIVTSSLFHEDFEKARDYSQVIDYQTKPFTQNNFNLVVEKYQSFISV